MDAQTDMFTMSRSSSHGRIAVALPLSSWRRHTNPGLTSATALMGSMAAKNSATIGSSRSARRRAMLSWAMCIGTPRALGR